jgi:hypothetical protein
MHLVKPVLPWFSPSVLHAPHIKREKTLGRFLSLFLFVGNSSTILRFSVASLYEGTSRDGSSLHALQVRREEAFHCFLLNLSRIWSWLHLMHRFSAFDAILSRGNEGHQLGAILSKKIMQ